MRCARVGGEHGALSEEADRLANSSGAAAPIRDFRDATRTKASERRACRSRSTRGKARRRCTATLSVSRMRRPASASRRTTHCFGGCATSKTTPVLANSSSSRASRACLCTSSTHTRPTSTSPAAHASTLGPPARTPGAAPGAAARAALAAADDVVLPAGRPRQRRRRRSVLRRRLRRRLRKRQHVHGRVGTLWKHLLQTRPI